MAEENKEFLGYPSFQEFSQVGKLINQLLVVCNRYENTIVMFFIGDLLDSRN